MNTRNIAAVLSFLFVSVVFVVSRAQAEVILIIDPGHGGADQGGWDGRGFCQRDLGGERVCIPEDAYAYDIAKRLELYAKERGWITVFTVRDKIAAEHVTDSDENHILPPRRNLIFNLPPPYTIVERSREALGKRVGVSARILRQYADATPIFVSIHVDIAPPYVSGLQVFAAAEPRSETLAATVARVAKEKGFEHMAHGKEISMIDTTKHLFLLRRGVVSPRVLVEVGNIQNERDHLAILRTEGRQFYAYMIAEAVAVYVNTQKKR